MLTQQFISRNVLEVNGPDQYGYCPCALYDGESRYTGQVFPSTSHHLYWMFERDKLLDEIMVCCTTKPDRQRRDDVLCGMILCLSGGHGEERSTYPSAAKIAFRHLGSLTEAYEATGMVRVNEDFCDLYKHARYIEPADESDPGTRELFGEIANSISADDIPFALRMVHR